MTVKLALRSLGLESRATMGIGLNGGAVAFDSQRREPLVIAVTRFMKSRSDDIGSANATAPPLIPTIFRPHKRILRRTIRLSIIRRIVRDWETLASLPRLGKPSDYERRPNPRMKSRSDDIGSANATAPPLIPTIFRPHKRLMRGSIRLILHSPNCSQLGYSRFAPSAWKAERLWASGSRRITTYVRIDSADPSFAELFMTVKLALRSLGLESRATMGLW